MSTKRYRHQVSIRYMKIILERIGAIIYLINLCNAVISHENCPKSSAFLRALFLGNFITFSLLISCKLLCQQARERGGRSLRQGTFSIVETVVPSMEVTRAGEQLCVLLGFRTTEDNCVDTAEADSERCQEARSWRDWTGIGTLYQV